MDRQITHTGALIPNATLLGGEKAKLVSLGYALEAILGASVSVAGLPCSPTSPASLAVVVGPGSIMVKSAIDPTSAFGDLGTDTKATVKQGILQEPGKTLLITPPAASGYSQVFLVQVACQDVDSGTVLPYYNAANPSQPFNGPNNSGDEETTLRASVCVVALKAGVAAPTGSQTIPAPDVGYTGLYAITVANGQTAINASNISQIAAAPFIATPLPAIPAGVQSGQWTCGVDTGTADNYVVSLTPYIANISVSQRIFVRFLTSNQTTSPVINVNGVGNRPILLRGGGAPAVGDVPAGWRWIFYDGAAFRLEGAAPSEITLSVKNYLLGLPPVLQLFCDPVNGNDANSGLTVATAKQSLDTILDNLGTTATNVILLNDTIIRRRRNVYPALSIYGAQAAANAQGFSFTTRNIGFLATADNSPQPNIGSFCSGMWLFSTNFFSSYINFNMPNQAAGQDYVAHISSDYGTNITLQLGAIQGTSNNTGYLFWSRANPLFVFLSGVTFGSFAAGHIFQGINAGSDPNTVYNYKSNITSA